METGMKIKRLRKSAGMTQSELASILHTTKQTIYKYETGIVTNIPADKIALISTIFGCAPSYLMGWEEQKHAVPDIILSDMEKKLIISYRNADIVGKEMVHRALGIAKSIEKEKIKKASMIK